MASDAHSVRSKGDGRQPDSHEHRRDLVGTTTERRRRRAPQVRRVAHFIRGSHVRLPEPERARRDRSRSSRPKAAAAWLRELPSLDIVARQQLVAARVRGHAPIAPAGRLRARAGAAIRRCGARCRPPPTLQAIRREPGIRAEGFRAASGRRASISRRASSPRTSTCSRPRWRRRRSGAGSRRCRSCSRGSSTITARTRSCACAGTSAGFPAKWVELHRTFMRASELGVERVATALGGNHGSGTQWTVEQEYVYALLVHQLNSGNLSPANLDWAATQIRAWSRRLELVALPKTMEGFFVDLAGRAGLVRRTGPGFGRDAALPRYDGARRAARHDARRAAPLGRDRPGARGADQPAARD